MDTNGVVAIIAAVVLGFLVRMFNVIVEWLARVLGVDAPEPIPAPSAAVTGLRPSTGRTGPNPAPPDAIPGGDPDG